MKRRTESFLQGMIVALFVLVIFAPAFALAGVSNPGFETGTGPWVFYTNGSGTFANNAAGAGSAKAGLITISNPGTNVQLYQAGQALEPNTRYTLSFKAYSNTGHDLSVSLLKHGSPYTYYGLSARYFNLTTAWSTFTVEFTTSGFTGTVNDGRLLFWIAPYDAGGDRYFFDDVVLAKTGVTPPPVTSVPVITSDPVGKSVSVGMTATFSVSATGTSPLSYRWQKNGSNISGATGASYTTPTTTLADSGATFLCVVSNAYGSDTSNSATLTVTSTPPPPPSGNEPPPPSSFTNRQLIYVDQTFDHTTAYGCQLVNGIWYPNGAVPYPYPAPAGSVQNVCNHEGFKFFQLPSWNPSSWTSPINYSQGTLYQRIIVYSKPSTITAKYASCMFQDQVLAERHACANTVPFTGTGTYYANQPMTSIYQYYGNSYSANYRGPAVLWDRKPHVVMVHMTDANNHQPDSYPGFMNLWIGTPNWALYYPTRVRYTAIIVPPGGGAPVWPQ